MASLNVPYEENYTVEVIQNVHREFLRLKGLTYLDHTASTHYAESQIKSIHDDLLCSVYGNPHSLSLSSKHTYEAIELIRFRILSHFHNPEDYSVVFTSGATSALKLVVETFDWMGSCKSQPHGEHEAMTGGGYSKFQSGFEDSKLGKYCGNFFYFNESHTSVIGMREVAEKRGAFVKSITNSELKECFARKKCSAQPTDSAPNSLFVYAAQCNFSGVKYPLKWIDLVQNGALNSCVPGKPTNWFCFLDAATFVSTNDLNLSKVKPDFVCISFYKIFGYPTGLGALLIRNSVGNILKKEYFGGGSVSISLSNRKFHVPRPGFERFEDGTIPFLSILSLHHGFDTIYKLVGSMSNISEHTFNLARYFYTTLVSMSHSNGKPVAKVYCDTYYDNMDTQGNIVNFNLQRANGDYVGYAEVLHMANLHNIHLRTGCFCNSGACQRHLCLSDEELLKNFEAGHICGDTMDLINGKPTGSVRISFGYMSTKSDADSMLAVIHKCFIENQGATLKEFNSFSLDDTQVKKLTEEQHVAHPSSCPSKSEFLYNPDILYGEQKGILETVSFSNPSLSHIFLYPVKSCGAFQVNSWPIGSHGLLYDRQWMIVTSNGVCLTQKRAPMACMIHPTINLEKEELLLSYPGMQPITVPLNVDDRKFSFTSTLCQSKVCGNKVQVVDCGDAVAEWLTNALQDSSLGSLRLHCQYCNVDKTSASSNCSKSSGQRKDLSLSNQAQFLLINYTSVRWLLENTEKDIPDAPKNEEDLLSRFRCNFVIKGTEKLRENNWNTVKIGEITFQSEGPCTRCQIICIDQSTGEKTKEPLTTIARLFNGKIRFGIYLTCIDTLQTQKNVAVGDAVECSE